MFPILFSLGPIKIYSFGVFCVIAAVLCAFIIWREGYRKRYDEEKMIDLFLVLGVFGIIGARIYYVATHLNDFSAINPIYWFFIFHFPGLSFWGALIGIIFGLRWFAKKNNFEVWEIADFTALGLAAGEILGRLGAFLSGSAYGIVTNLPIGVPMIGLLGKRHPVQIYEAFITFIIFIIIIKLKSRFFEKKLAPGFLFLSYLLMISFSKFALEFVRGDSVYWKGWRINQIVCLVFVLFSTVLIYKRLGRSVKNDFKTIKEKIYDKISNKHLKTA